MKDVGMTAKEMYPSMEFKADAKHYPEVTLPLSLCPDCKVGEKLNVEFEATVESIDKKTIRVKLLKAEETENAQQEKDEDSILGKA